MARTSDTNEATAQGTLRLVREGKHLIVLGAKVADLARVAAASGSKFPQLLEIREALDEFNISNAHGWRWDASVRVLVYRRDKRWDARSDDGLSVDVNGVATIFGAAIPKDLRTAVMLTGFTADSGEPLSDALIERLYTGRALMHGHVPGIVGA